MFPEPITAISTAAGLLGFIISIALSTTEKIYLTREALKEHHELLIAHKYTLRTCELRLSSWYILWFPGGFYDEGFAKQLWGENGAQELLGLIVQIVQAAETVKSKLYSTADERNLPLRAGVLQMTDRRWSRTCEAITFALWRNAALKEPVAKLKDLVQHLDGMSHDYYFLEHGRDGLKVTQNNVLALERSERRFQSVSNALSLAYEYLNGKIDLFGLHETWALLCTRAWPDTLCALETESEFLDIDFLKLDGEVEEDAVGYNIHESLSMDRPSAETQFGERLRDKQEIDGNYAPEYRLSRSLKDTFNCLAKVPLDSSGKDTTKQRYARGIMPLRAQAAFVLASWMALMWNTPWLQSLCSCSIRPAHSGDASYVAVFRRTDHETNGCCDVEFYQHQHLLLGVALAEIALGRGVCVQRIPGLDRPVFIVSHTGRHDDTETLSSRSLIKRVGDAVNSSDYEAALTYCFRLHEGLEKQTGPAATSMQYQRNVVQPLKRFYEHVQKVYENGGKRMWDVWQDDFYRFMT